MAQKVSTKQVTYTCRLPPSETTIRKPQEALPLPTSATANLEWASVFVDYAAYLIKGREKEYENLNINYKSAQDEIRQYKNDVEKLKKDVAREKAAHHALHQVLDHARAQARTEKKNLTDDLNNKTKHLHDAEADVNNLRAKLKKADKDAHAAWLKERRHDDEDHQALETLQRRLEKEQKTTASLQEQLADKLKEVLRKEQELQDAKDKQVGYETEIAQMRKDIEYLKQDIADRESALAKSQLNLAQRDTQNASLTAEKEQLSADLATKKIELLQREQELAKAQTEVIGLKETVAKQEASIEEVSIQLKDQQAKNTTSEKTIAELQEMNKKLFEHDKQDEQKIVELDREREAILEVLRKVQGDDLADKSTIEALRDIVKGLNAFKGHDEAHHAELDGIKAIIANYLAGNGTLYDLEQLLETSRKMLAHNVRLSNPIALAGAPRDIDDASFPINCPFPVKLYNTTSTKIYVSVNGLFTLNSASNRADNHKLPCRKGFFPWGGLPDVTLAPFWADLKIYKNTPQGVYYEISGQAPNRKLEVEWYVARHQKPEHCYHFRLVVEEAKPNLATFKYFKVSDKGANCTVGIQGPETSNMFNCNEGKVLPGTQVTFNTVKNTFEATNFKVQDPAAKATNVVSNAKPTNKIATTVVEVGEVD